MTFHSHLPKYLTNFPNMGTRIPLHISINRLERGYESHRHDFLEFSYVLSGTGSESIDGVLHPMMPGTFTFVLPYQFHELHSEPHSPLILVNCMFGIDFLVEIGLESGMHRLLDETDLASPFVRFTGEEEVRMRALLEEMMREYNSDRRWRSAMMKARLVEALILFDRQRKDVPANEYLPADSDADSAKAKGERHIWEVLHYLHTHYREPLTLSSLAERFRISDSRFSEWFKQATGQTYLHYLHDVRLRHGCALLAASKLSITEIALEIGYGSYKTFNRIFKEKKGMTPKEYRRYKQTLKLS